MPDFFGFRWVFGQVEHQFCKAFESYKWIVAEAAKNAAAKFKDGVLTITLPKAEESVAENTPAAIKTGKMAMSAMIIESPISSGRLREPPNMIAWNA